MSSFGFDPTAGVLFVNANGVRTVEDTRRFVNAFRAQVSAVREKAGRLRMLGDSRESSLRSPEATAAEPGSSRTSSRMLFSRTSSEKAGRLCRSNGQTIIAFCDEFLNRQCERHSQRLTAT